jgi:hypothetical protein
MRFDFAVHETGEVISRYLNLGQNPNSGLRSRSDYFKLWVMATGRKPQHGEPMDPTRIVGIEFWVIVVDREFGDGGGTYSVIESIKKPVAHEPLGSVALNSPALNSHALNSHALNSHALNSHALNSDALNSDAQVETESSPSEEFPLEAIPPRGPERWQKIKSIRETDPEMAQRFLEACRQKDVA